VIQFFVADLGPKLMYIGWGVAEPFRRLEVDWQERNKSSAVAETAAQFKFLLSNRSYLSSMHCF